MQAECLASMDQRGGKKNDLEDFENCGIIRELFSVNELSINKISHCT